jgi:hypothetical protein
VTLATADGAGRPWVSLVWFASADRLEFFWVSSPDARHSRNLSVRREVAIVIFDSRVPVGDAEAVYIAAAAAQATRAELAGGIHVFSRVARSGTTRVDARGRRGAGPASPLSRRRF